MCVYDGVDGVDGVRWWFLMWLMFAVWERWWMIGGKKVEKEFKKER